MHDANCFRGTRSAIGLLLLSLSIAFPSFAHGQGIFSDLPYDETFIRSKIEQYSLSVDSLTGKGSIPENIYFRLVFQDVLSDQSLLSGLPAEDIEIIRNLPAHEDHSFLVKDHEDLTAICSALSLGTFRVSDVIYLAISFDNARMRREQDLDVHYQEVLNSLTLLTQELVLDFMSEFGETKNIGYSTFDMQGLAADVPGVAKAILQNGCDNFSDQLTTYAPQKVMLKDQLPTLTTLIDQ